MTSLFLVGPMGSGKSTVGRALANKIGYQFLDSDREIEARCGVDIPTIFDYEGEAGFRDRESRMIDELTNLPGIVLATGGGSILRDENRNHLKGRGHVILLQVDIKEQLRRVAFDSNRPLLKTDDPEARLKSLMEEREPIYKSVADIEISTDSRRMYHVVTRILRHLKKTEVPLEPAPKELRGVNTRKEPLKKPIGNRPGIDPKTEPNASTEAKSGTGPEAESGTEPSPSD